MTQTEALKLALEALKKSHPYSNTDKDLDKHSETITAIKAALEAKDEPVAWADKGVVNWIADKQFMSEAELFTHPPQRKPLTDEEINALDYSGTRIEFVRSIEAKLRSKND
jgi:hypothetical protein